MASPSGQTSCEFDSLHMSWLHPRRPAHDLTASEFWHMIKLPFPKVPTLSHTLQGQQGTEE